jgi:hypothetical protein
MTDYCELAPHTHAQNQVMAIGEEAGPGITRGEAQAYVRDSHRELVVQQRADEGLRLRRAQTSSAGGI